MCGVLRLTRPSSKGGNALDRTVRIVSLLDSVRFSLTSLLLDGGREGGGELEVAGALASLHQSDGAGDIADDESLRARFGVFRSRCRVSSSSCAVRVSRSRSQDVVRLRFSAMAAGPARAQYGAHATFDGIVDRMKSFVDGGRRRGDVVVDVVVMDEGRWKWESCCLGRNRTARDAPHQSD